MNMETPQINLVFGWAGILAGFISGMVLGLFFHQDNWLGGYASFQRRMYRLGHISFFGLGAVNLVFFFTAQFFNGTSPQIHFASWAFIIGAITMPICCVVMARFPKAHMIFAVPVVSLITGGTLTMLEVIKL
jgi:hypothetical protein